jgi:hypothetical protein
MVKYGGYVIEPLGRVYIGIQGLIWSTRQETYSISILSFLVRRVSLTPPAVVAVV